MESKNFKLTPNEGDIPQMLIEIKSMLQTLVYLEVKKIAKDENREYKAVLEEIQSTIGGFIENNVQGLGGELIPD